MGHQQCSPEAVFPGFNPFFEDVLITREYLEAGCGPGLYRYAKAGSSRVTIFEKKSNGVYKQLDDLDDEKFSSTISKDTINPTVRIIFVPQEESSWGISSKCAYELFSKYDICSRFLDFLEFLRGPQKGSFGYRYVYDSEGIVTGGQSVTDEKHSLVRESFDMWYRCAWTQPRTGRPFSSSIYLVPPPKEHPWHRMAVYTKYKASTAQQAASTTVLVFYNESIKEMLLGELWKVVNSAQEESLERNPFELQALVHKLVFTGAHARLWAARETLRGMESEGTNRGKILGGKNLYKVHQFGRELVGLEDALSELTQNIRSLKAQHELIFDLRMHGAANNIDVQLARRASSALECLEGNFTSLSCGYKGFMKRLELLNNLNYLVITREDARNSSEIATAAREDARTSCEIAKAARKDSAAMKVIAYMTLAFLPFATVAAIFAMPFFSNNGAGGLHVEGQIRVFFSVAIACTLATLLVAGFWLQQRPAKTEKGNVLHIEVQEKDAEAAWHEESIGFHKMGSQIS